MNSDRVTLVYGFSGYMGEVATKRAGEGVDDKLRVRYVVDIIVGARTTLLMRTLNMRSNIPTNIELALFLKLHKRANRVRDCDIQLRENLVGASDDVNLLAGRHHWKT